MQPFVQGLGSVLLGAGLLGLLLGTVRPWYVLWWRDYQNRWIVWQLFGSLALLGALLWAAGRWFF